MEDKLQRYEELARETQTGWWVANLNKREFKCSSFISELLEIDTDTFTFDYFISKISEEFREVIIKDVMEYDSPQSEYCRTMYSANIPRGKVWISAHTSSKIVLENGECIRKGFIQLIDPPQEAKSPIIISKVNDLALGLNSISKILKKFLDKDIQKDTINEILLEILHTYKGDRSYVFLFDDDNKYQTCKYEVTEKGVSAEISQLQKLKYEDVPWWSNKIKSKQSIILDDIMKLPQDAEAEYKFLKSQDIQSIMVVPLIGENDVLGYLGIDIVKRKYNWTKEDFQWLLSMANIISIFMTLKDSQEQLCNEQIKLKAANKSLKVNEEKMKKLFAHIPIGAAYFDLNGKPTQYNNKGLDVFGLTSIEDVNDYSFFKDPNVPQEVLDKIKYLDFVEYDTTYDFEKLRPIVKSWRNGSIKLYIKIAKLHDDYGNPIGYLMACIEDTDKMMANNRIRDFESFFSVISESAKIGYAKLNLLNNKGYAIKQWYTNIGEDEKKSVSQIIKEYEHLHPEDREDILKFFSDVREGKVKSYNKEVRVHLFGNPPGKWNWLYKSLVVTRFAPEENDIEVIGVNYDITKLKDTANELRIARDKAQEMDKLKMAFLANMSHEIRTPLNSIVGFADLLAINVEPEDKKRYISILHENSDLLLQLISDILDLSKIESGTVEYSFNVINVKMLCNDLINSLKPKVKRDVKLEFDNELPDYHIISDWKRIQQVLKNLINNAIKFTSDGHIRVGYSLNNDMIQFDVTDTGIGIKEEMLPRIFSRFTKVNSFVQGTGLGLSICKSIVESMHGNIGVESTYGKGSHFWFTLPYDDNNEVNSEKKLKEIMTPLIQSEEDISKRKLVLVAEDEESNYELLYAILSDKYDIAWAKNGQETVDLYKKMQPDMILMDIKMSGMDGLQATKIIRQSDNNIPIIAITAYASEKDKEDAIEAGLDDFMTKPISPKELRNKMIVYLGR